MLRIGPRASVCDHLRDAAAGLALLAGGALCVPALLRGAARLARWLARPLPPSVRLAAAALDASPRRTSVAIAVLAVALALAVGLSISIASFRVTVLAWASDTVRADVNIRPLVGTQLPENVASRVRRVPGVAHLNDERRITLPYRGGEFALATVDASAL